MRLIINSTQKQFVIFLREFIIKELQSLSNESFAALNKKLHLDCRSYLIKAIKHSNINKYQDDSYVLSISDKYKQTARLITYGSLDVKGNDSLLKIFRYVVDHIRGLYFVWRGTCQ